MATVYGLNVYKPGKSSFDISVDATRAGMSNSAIALIDQQVANDSTGVASQRYAVLDLYDKYEYAPPTGILPYITNNNNEYWIRYWMTNGVSSFKGYYKNLYETSGATWKNNIDTYRYNANNVLSPFAPTQLDNEVTTPSWSTQDNFGNNKTSLFIPFVDAIAGQSTGIWTTDLATLAGLANNTITTPGTPTYTYSDTEEQARYGWKVGPNAYIQIPQTGLDKYDPKFEDRFNKNNGYAFEFYIKLKSYGTDVELLNYKRTVYAIDGPTGVRFYINSSGYLVWEGGYPHDATFTSYYPLLLDSWKLITFLFDPVLKAKYILVDATIWAWDYVTPVTHKILGSIDGYFNNHDFEDGMGGSPDRHYGVIRMVPDKSIYGFSQGDIVKFHNERDNIYRYTATGYTYKIVAINYERNYVGLDAPLSTADATFSSAHPPVYMYKVMDSANTTENNAYSRWIVNAESDGKLYFAATPLPAHAVTPNWERYIDTPSSWRRRPSYPIGCAVMFRPLGGGSLETVNGLSANTVYYVSEYGGDTPAYNGSYSGGWIKIVDRLGNLQTPYISIGNKVLLYKVNHPQSSGGFGTFPVMDKNPSYGTNVLAPPVKFGLMSTFDNSSIKYGYLGQIRMSSVNPYSADSAPGGKSFWLRGWWENNGVYPASTFTTNIGGSSTVSTTAITPSLFYSKVKDGTTWTEARKKDFGSGATIYSGSYIPAVVQGAASIPNILGLAGFNGGYQHYYSIYTLTGAWNFAPGTDFTVELYTNTAVWDDTIKYLIGSFNSNPGLNVSSWYIGIGPDPYFLTIRLDTQLIQITNTIVNGAYKWNTNNLYHIALTRSGTTVRVFIDGELVWSGQNNIQLGAYPYLLIGTNYPSGNYTVANTGLEFAPTTYFKGYIASPRIVKGKALYTSAFNKITRTAKLTRDAVLSSYAFNKKTTLYPDEQSVQYWQLVGVTAGTSQLQFSSTDFTWNQVDFFYLAGGSSFSKNYISCVGRTIVVSQYVLGTPDINISYTVGAYTTNSSTGNVSIAAGTVASYVIILMK